MYVGQSVRNRSAYRGGGTIVEALRKKHGLQYLSKKILLHCEQSELDRYEKWAIEKYNTIRPNGLNIKEGGQGEGGGTGWKHSQNTLKKLRKPKSKKGVEGITKARNVEGRNDCYRTEEFRDLITKRNKEYYATPEGQEYKKVLGKRLAERNVDKGREKFFGEQLEMAEKVYTLYLQGLGSRRGSRALGISADTYNIRIRQYVKYILQEEWSSWRANREKV